MSESDDCLFCKIIAGEIPSEKVYEDDEDDEDDDDEDDEEESSDEE